MNETSGSRYENDTLGYNFHFRECFFKTVYVERSLHKTYSRQADKLVSYKVFNF